MASQIDPNEPQEGLTTTLATRTNFSYAKSEIETEQSRNDSQDTDIAGKEPANANIQEHIASIANPHGVSKAQIGLGNADNTSDLAKPISTATQAALDAKEPLIGAKGTAFNKNFGTGLDQVAVGNHSHTAAEVGAAPASHVGDDSHLSADERAAMDIAAPTGADPLVTQSDVQVHAANQEIHITSPQNLALDGANNPSGANVFATMADVGTGAGHVIQDPTGTPVPDQPNLQFTGDVTVTDDSGNNRTVVNVTAGAGTGEANTGSNIGTGVDVFSSKVVLDLQFRRLNEIGGGLTLTQNLQDITFSLNYAGSGAEDTLARSDHNHNGVYDLFGAAAAVQADLDGHKDHDDFHLSTDERDAVDAAAAPTGLNAFATMADINGGVPADAHLDGYTEQGDTTLVSSAGTLTLPLDGRVYRVTLTEDTTLAVSGVPVAPIVASTVLYVLNSGASRIISIPATWRVPNSTALVPASAQDAENEFILRADPAGNIVISGGEIGLPA